VTTLAATALDTPRAGGIGLLSLFAALFSRGNSAETLKLLFYGAAIEVGRRVFTWLSERVFVRECTSSFRDGVCSRFYLQVQAYRPVSGRVIRRTNGSCFI
jgi:hypothetical protein